MPRGTRPIISKQGKQGHDRRIRTGSAWRFAPATWSSRFLLVGPPRGTCVFFFDLPPTHEANAGGHCFVQSNLDTSSIHLVESNSVGLIHSRNIQINMLFRKLAVATCEFISSLCWRHNTITRRRSIIANCNPQSKDQSDGHNLRPNLMKENGACEWIPEVTIVKNGYARLI